MNTCVVTAVIVNSGSRSMPLWFGIPLIIVLLVGLAYIVVKFPPWKDVDKWK